MKRRPLLIAIGSAILVGVVARATGCAGEVSAVVAPLEDVFVRLIRLVVFPLAFLALVAALFSFGSSRKAGLFGLKALVVFLMTSFVSATFAVTVGLLVRGLFDAPPIIRQGQGEQATFAALVQTLVPDSILRPFIDSSLSQMLIIGFVAALVVMQVLELGVGVRCRGGGRCTLEWLRDFFERLARMAFVLVPPGVFCVICARIVNSGSLSVEQYWRFVAVVYFCLAVHVLVFDTALVYFFRGIRPLDFLKHVAPVALMALATCSSSVTYPLVRRKALELGVGGRCRGGEVATSLGLTLNSDGTLICNGLAVVGMAFGMGLNLGFGRICLLIAVLVLVSCFLEDGMPGGNAALLGFLMTMVGLPADSAVVLAGIDLLLDPGCTIANSVGDVAVAAVLRAEESNG